MIAAYLLPLVIGRFLITIIMHKEFAIKHVRNSSWIDLDYHTGDEVIYVKSYLTALKFDTKEKAKDFCFRHKLDLGNHELFQLEVLASPRRWV